VPGLLDRFSPQQRQMLLYGVPAVAALAVISMARNKGESEEIVEADPREFSTMPMPSTDAIGTGQLAEFESSVTQRLNELTELFHRSPPPPASTTPQSPTPTTTVPNPDNATPTPVPPPSSPTTSPTTTPTPTAPTSGRSPTWAEQNVLRNAGVTWSILRVFPSLSDAMAYERAQGGAAAGWSSGSYRGTYMGTAVTIRYAKKR
jgi:hypothetical protein